MRTGISASLEQSYVIPVVSKTKSGSTITLEDGILTDCDHEGATFQRVAFERLVVDDGNYTPVDDSQEGYLCPDCRAFSVDREEWYE